jgi:hypothetical protein
VETQYVLTVSPDRSFRRLASFVGPLRLLAAVGPQMLSRGIPGRTTSPTGSCASGTTRGAP